MHSSAPRQDALQRSSLIMDTHARTEKTNRAFRLHPNLLRILITEAGTDRILTLDLHANQIVGFFKIPVDHLYAAPVILKYISQQKFKNLTIVSPDAGGVERARAFAVRLNAQLAIVDKRRVAPNVAESMNVIGDVAGRTCVIVDDIIDTAGTLTSTAESLKQKGADKIFATCSHPVFSGPAIERINQSPLEQVVVTNTIPLSKEARRSQSDSVIGGRTSGKSNYKYS